MKGLILDLRFNPGGRLDQAKEVVDLFLEEGMIVCTKGRNRPEESSYATEAGHAAATSRWSVLVNEHSASAQRDRRGQPDGQQARRWCVGAADVRQGQRAGSDPAGRQGRRAEADRRVLLPAQRPARAPQEGRDRLGRRAADHRADGRGAQRKVLHRARRRGDVQRPLPKRDDASRRRTSDDARRRPADATCSSSGRWTR